MPSYVQTVQKQAPVASFLLLAEVIFFFLQARDVIKLEVGEWIENQLRKHPVSLSGDGFTRSESLINEGKRQNSRNFPNWTCKGASN